MLGAPLSGYDWRSSYASMLKTAVLPSPPHSGNCRGSDQPQHVRVQSSKVVFYSWMIRQRNHNTLEFDIWA